MNELKKPADKSDFRQGRWGSAYKNGKLYEFTDKYVLVMKGWPDPRAWFKRRSHGWIPTRKWADELFSHPAFLEKTPAPEKPAKPFTLPNGQMILPGVVIPEERWAWREYSDYVARTSFINMMPDEIREELRKYSVRRWHLLSLFARCPGAVDLSHSNPALLFALASNWVFHKPAVTKPVRAARSLVWKKQKVILEWLGFPGTEPVRRLLAKIRPDAVDVESLLYLREALRNPACLKLLSHLPELNRAAVMLASDRRIAQHVTPKLLEDVLEDTTAKEFAPVAQRTDGYRDAYRLMTDTMRMARIVDWEKCPKTFCSVKRLNTVHDELVPMMDLAQLKMRHKIPDRFQEPPFKGTEHIVPLITPEEVFKEGHVQKNCVGSHVLPILEGREYVYRVEQPVRATLAIVRKAGSWIPDQFLKACNEQVSSSVRHKVFAMLFQTRDTQQVIV